MHPYFPFLMHSCFPKIEHICFLVTSCSNTVINQKESGLITKVELKGCFQLPQHEDAFIINDDSMLYYLIDVKLVNTSDRSIEFITYSCTSVGNIVLDNKLFRICVNRCSGNAPMLLVLRPKQEFYLPIILQTNIRDTIDRIKVGWIYIGRDNESISTSGYMPKLLTRKRINLEDVIWSEPLCLNSSGGIPFTIR